MESGENYDPDYTFDVHYILPSDSINTDKIYLTVKNANDDSMVYFDGIIRTKSDGKPDFRFDYDNGQMFDNPGFEFLITDINTASKSDTLSYNLRNAIELSFLAKKQLNIKSKKKFLSEELDKQLSFQ